MEVVRHSIPIGEDAVPISKACTRKTRETAEKAGGGVQ